MIIISVAVAYLAVSIVLNPAQVFAAINTKFYPNTTCTGSDAISFVLSTDVCVKSTGLGSSHNHFINIYSPLDSVNPFTNSTTGTGNREIAFQPNVCGTWTAKVIKESDSSLQDSATFAVTGCVTPTPFPSATPTPTPVVSSTPTPSATPVVSPTPEITPALSPTPTAEPISTPSATPTPTIAPTSTPTPSTTPTPLVNLHFIKVLCPAYSDLTGNADADKHDATGGFFTNFINYILSIPHFANPYALSPIDPSEIPEVCTRLSGWSFKLSSDESQTGDVQVVGGTDINGEINITSNDLNVTLKNLLLSNNKVWISEVQNTSVAKFGAIRCYKDAVNGDNLEYLQFSSVPSDVYCIAYNVPLSTPVPTPSATPTNSPAPVISSTPSPIATPTPEVSPTPSSSPTATPTPESTPASSGGGGGGNGGGGSNGGSNNPGIGSPQPAEGFVDFSGGQVAGANTGGEVLGASTNACTKYMEDYIKLGKKNRIDQVIKLQTFLNSHMKANLPVTGFYGNITAKAVNDFQLKYSEDVLAPWVPHGLKSAQTPTSYVYKTTLWKINMIMCPSLGIGEPMLP